jgi:hypothetical protein
MISMMLTIILNNCEKPLSSQFGRLQCCANQARNLLRSMRARAKWFSAGGVIFESSPSRACLDMDSQLDSKLGCEMLGKVQQN